MFFFNICPPRVADGCFGIGGLDRRLGGRYRPRLRPPVLGASSPALLGTIASVGPDPCAAGSEPVTSWAPAPAWATASRCFSRFVAAWSLVTQATSSAAVRIITTAPDQSTFTRVGPVSSALRLCPDIGTRGLDPDGPEPPDGACDGPTVEPPAGRALLGALVNGAS